MSSQLNYKDDELDGLCKEWYENGQMSSQLNYKDEELDGLCKEWYENGQMSSQLNYKDGELEGLYKTWYKNGQICIEANFLGPAGSTAMSSYKTFWPNGNARSKFVYKKPFNLNNPDSWDSGTFTQYYSNGAKLRETDEFYLTTDNTDLYEFYSEFQIHMKNGATKMIDY
jgi:antitoxin component YwqK of YwqJK toxin-antitoxin module